MWLAAVVGGRASSFLLSWLWCRLISPWLSLWGSSEPRMILRSGAQMGWGSQTFLHPHLQVTGCRLPLGIPGKVVLSVLTVPEGCSPEAWLTAALPAAQPLVPEADGVVSQQPSTSLLHSVLFDNKLCGDQDHNSFSLHWTCRTYTGPGPYQVLHRSCHEVLVFHLTKCFTPGLCVKPFLSSGQLISCELFVHHLECLQQ